MALEATNNLPNIEDFVPLYDYEQETPTTFFGGKAVLHLKCPEAQIRISSDDLAAQPVLASLRHDDVQQREGDSEEVVLAHIDAWVTSSYLALVSSAKGKCIHIPYQTITIHAQEGSAVLLGLNLSDTNTPDEDLIFIQLRLVPGEVERYQEKSEDRQSHHPNGNGTHASDAAQALFQAIADCQELNPDPPEEGDEEFDETAPGATGWITSENMQDYVDENGEFRIPDGLTVVGDEVEENENEDEPHWPLGQGAGRVRTADEFDAADGVEEDAKWQRTG